MKPICEHCSQRVMTAADRSTDQFAAWCGCNLTSPTDPHHRGVGYGDTEEAAIAAWRAWTPTSR